MAMIICRECGKDISDKASRCPNCGCPIILQDSIPPVPDTKPKRKKVFLYCFFILLILLLLVLSAVMILIKKKKKAKKEECESKYVKAYQLQTMESYVEAGTLYDEIKGYKDSADRALFCQAQALSHKGKYAEAYNLLMEIPEYEETAELLLQFYYETRFFEAIPQLTETMKNPESLQIISIDFYYTDGKKDAPVIILTKSGLNGYGGYSSGYALISEITAEKRYTLRGECKSLDYGDYDLTDYDDCLQVVYANIVIQTAEKYDKLENVLDIKRVKEIIASKDYYKIRRIDELYFSDVLEALLNHEAKAE